MFNPLVDSLSELSDSEIEDKIIELGRKMNMTANPDLQNQVFVVLEMYREEAALRRAKSYQKTNDNDDNGLDNLINIS